MRRVRLVLAFLLIGAIVNVLVAWACARWVDPWLAVEHPVVHDAEVPASMLALDAETAADVYGQWAPFPPAQVMRFGYTAGGYASSHYLFSRGEASVVRVIQCDSFGWPMLSMGYLRSQVLIPGATQGPPPCVAGWRGGWRPFENDVFITESWRVYPLVPLPIGFAANTAFYALLPWLPLAGFAALRKRRRARRGLCVACGYDVGSLTVCPECGKATA